MEKRVVDFETDVKERISAADESVQLLREGLRGELEKVLEYTVASATVANAWSGYLKNFLAVYFISRSSSN